MAVDTDFTTDGGEDARDLRFFPADPKAARTLSPARIEHFDRAAYPSGLPAFPDDEIAWPRAYCDGNPVPDAD